MNSSQELKELATALAKAQAVMEGAKKDSANPFFKSKYADLQSVWEACRNALTEQGLSVAQFGSVDSTLGEVIVTRLLHSSGQWLEGITKVRAKDESPQAMGSGITYARRYGLAAMVGIYQTDDDAEAAQGRPAKSYADHSGRVDTDGVDQVKVQKAAQDMTNALLKRNDEAVLKLHDDLNQDVIFYQAVHDKFSQVQKDSIRDAIVRARKERAAQKELKVKAAF